MKPKSSKQFNPLDPETLQEEAKMVTNFITNYYKNVEKYPVRSQVEPGYLKKLISSDLVPENPEKMEVILDEIDTKIVPGLTHWQSPNFFAYFQSNVSNAAFLGEMLCSGFNVVGFNWIASPAATELEGIVMDWMGQMLKLPQQFLFSGGGGSVIHGSTCESMLCTLAAARDRALDVLGPDKITKLVVYASDQTHFSFKKAAKLVGISPCNFREIPTSISKGFALSPTAVWTAMEADLARGLVPLYVCATIGTTACGAMDPIDGLGPVARHFGAWLHIDAACAGVACICSEYRHYLDGVELADSISMNAHKWFLTGIDCCCLWLKNPDALVNSLGTTPELLRNKATESAEVVDYKDWQIALNRRFRAIKLWLVIRRYGSTNLRAHIRSDIELAEHFERLVKKDERFDIVVPRWFTLVCFRLRQKQCEHDNESVVNKKLLEAVNWSGQVYMTHAVFGGMFVIRCAIGGTLTEKRHVDQLWRLIQDKATVILTTEKRHVQSEGH